MRARSLLAGLPSDPVMVKAMLQAFDEVWAVLAPRFPKDDAYALENASLSLAHALVAASNTCGKDVEALKAAALRSTSPHLRP